MACVLVPSCTWLLPCTACSFWLSAHAESLVPPGPSVLLVRQLQDQCEMLDDSKRAKAASYHCNCKNRPACLLQDERKTLDDIKRLKASRSTVQQYNERIERLQSDDGLRQTVVKQLETVRHFEAVWVSSGGLQLWLACPSQAISKQVSMAAAYASWLAHAECSCQRACASEPD